MPTQEEKALQLIRKAGVLRPRDLAPHGIPREALGRLVKRGVVNRIGRGVYELAESDHAEHLDLMEACKRVPDGVICLISALEFHGLTTQMPYQVWLAIDTKAHKPRIEHPPIRIVRFSRTALEFATKVHRIKGVPVRITTAARTVADCFKYRNKVGIDVAIEALKEYVRGSKGKMDELWESVEFCRVAKIIRPYLEAIQ